MLITATSTNRKMIQTGEHMSTVSNIPRKNNFLIKAIRGLLEHRATWLYLMLKEVWKKGIEWEEIGFPAIRACGHMHGQDLVDLSGTSSLGTEKEIVYQAGTNGF